MRIFMYDDSMKGIYTTCYNEKIIFHICQSEISNDWYIGFNTHHVDAVNDLYKALGINLCGLTKDERKKKIRERYIELGIPEDEISVRGIFLELKKKEHLFTIINAINKSSLYIKLL